jgi:hypothetical protein
MNVPYVKKYNEFGEIANPIEKSYVGLYPTRKQRREKLQKNRFHGESKNHHLTVLKTGKYRRVRQVIKLKNHSSVHPYPKWAGILRNRIRATKVSKVIEQYLIS